MRDAAFPHQSSAFVKIPILRSSRLPTLSHCPARSGSHFPVLPVPSVLCFREWQMRAFYQNRIILRKVRDFSRIGRPGIFILFFLCHVGQLCIRHRIMIILRKDFEEICPGFVRDHFRNDRGVAVVDYADRVLLTGTGEIHDQDTGAFGITSVCVSLTARFIGRRCCSSIVFCASSCIAACSQ